MAVWQRILYSSARGSVHHPRAPPESCLSTVCVPPWPRLFCGKSRLSGKNRRGQQHNLISAPRRREWIKYTLQSQSSRGPRTKTANDKNIKKQQGPLSTVDDLMRMTPPLSRGGRKNSLLLSLVVLEFVSFLSIGVYLVWVWL